MFKRFLYVILFTFVSYCNGLWLTFTLLIKTAQCKDTTELLHTRDQVNRITRLPMQMLLNLENLYIVFK